MQWPFSGENWLFSSKQISHIRMTDVCSCLVNQKTNVNSAEIATNSLPDFPVTIDWFGEWIVGTKHECMVVVVSARNEMKAVELQLSDSNAHNLTYKWRRQIPNWMVNSIEFEINTANEYVCSSSGIWEINDTTVLRLLFVWMLIIWMDLFRYFDISSHPSEIWLSSKHRLALRWEWRKEMITRSHMLRIARENNLRGKNLNFPFLTTSV